MPQKFLFLLKTTIFDEFLKLAKIAIIKIMTESQNHSKRSGSRTICDVIPGYRSLSSIEDSLTAVKSTKMPDNCVVFGCNNPPNKKEGIALHPIPFYGKEEVEKRKRRKKWVDFVKLKRAHWEPTKYSSVCSKHFTDEDFTVRFSELTKESLQRRLRRDEVGVCVFPTIHAPCVSNETKSAESQRSKRKVR